MLKNTILQKILITLAAFTCLLSGNAFAHGIGFQNTRIVMDPASIAILINRPVPGITASDNVGFIISVDTALLSGPVGYFTLYNPVGATVTNAQFVDSAYNMINATAPTAMPDGYGPRGVMTFTNWTATTGMGSVAVLNGDTGIFYSSNPITQLFNPNADGTITTSVLGATIRTTSQLMNVTATHNMWDANQTRAFGAGTGNAAANTPSTAPVINTVGTGTTPFRTGSAVAGPDVGYPLDNTGAVGPWNRISYPNSYTTLGVPSAAAPVSTTVAGALAVVGTPTTAGAGFPLPSATNSVRWAIGAPRFPGTYQVRASLQFNAAILSSPNGIILNSEATGADADGSNGGKDNVWRYHQPGATTLAGTNALYVAKDIIAVNGVASLNPATIPANAKLTYRIRYMNIGGLPQTNVVLSDTVPAQISTVCANITNVVSAGPAVTPSTTCPAANGVVTFTTIPKLNVGQGGAVTFDMQTVGSVNLTVTNTVKIVSTQNTTGTTFARTTLLQMPDVTITKSHVGNFGQGQIGAQYTITASNVGNFNTAGLVTVTDTLPVSLTATAAAGTGWTCTITAPANLITTCTRSDALAASAGYPPITLTVNVASNAATPRVNSVTIAGGGEANLANNTSTDSTIIALKPDLTITKTHTGNFFQGQNPASYSIVVSNIGGLQAIAGSVTVVDTLPAGLTFVSSAGANFTCTAAGKVVTCKNGARINANSIAAAITINVSVAANASTPLVNQATVTGGGELNTTNNNATDSTIILKPPVVLKTFSPINIVANTPSTLTISITNPNAVAMTLGATAAAGSAAFIDVFPTTPAPGMRVAAPLVQTNTCGGTLVNNLNTALAAGNLGIRLNNGGIPANSTCKVTVNVSSTVNGTFVNNSGTVATVGSGTGASSSATLNVIAPVAPTIVKNFSPNPVANTIPTTLTITVTNPNVVPIRAVAFTDTYPAGVLNTAAPAAAFTPASVTAGCTGTITGGAANGNNVGLSAGVIPADTSCDISVKVVAAAVGNYNNVTSAITTTNNGILVTGLPATKILDVQAAVPPFIAKVFAPASLGVNETSTLTFTITNPNNAVIGAIAGVAFSDTYPTNIVNAPTPNVVNNCGGIITGGTAGGNSIALSGATIPVNSSCTISVNVVSAIAGSYLNTSGAVSSTTPLVGTGNTASATLDVLAKSTISKAFGTPYILPGDTTTLTLTLNNPTAFALSNVAFTDNFPSNLLVATPNALNNGCGGTATAASGVVSLTGGSMIAGGSCSITLDVTSNIPGTYNNTSSGVSSIETGTAGASSNTASLTVVTKPSITKAFSPTSIVAGGTSTLTLQINNPNAIALTGLGFTDNFPADITVASIPSATNSCGGTFAPAANDVSINLANGGITANGTCTVSVKVTGLIAGSYANTADGVSSIETGIPGNPSNTVSLDITPPGVPVSGFVYSDANHNIQKDGAEAGTGLILFAKIVPTGGGPAIDAVTVNASTGAYQFAAIPVGDYIIIIDDNATLGDTSPASPAGWLGTEMVGLTRSNVLVNTTELQNLNFGLFNGSKLSGTVFSDTGIGAGIASNGIKDGGELGIAGVTVKASTGDTTITDGAGNYTLWIPASATGIIAITETNLNGYISTGGSAGNTGGSYTIGADATSFSFVAGNIYNSVNFGDVPVNTFAANGQQTALAGNVVFYAHRFVAGSSGNVVFNSDNTSGWPTIIYLDLNCNGQIDATDTVALGAMPVAAGQQICIINKVSIPAGTAIGISDITTVDAYFTSGTSASELSVFDTTTVGAVSAGLVLTKAVDKATAQPNDTVTYTLTYQNNSNVPIASIVINDTTPAYTTFLSSTCVLPLPTAISACAVTTEPATGATGAVKWTLTGTLAPAATGQVNYSVKVDN